MRREPSSRGLLWSHSFLFYNFAWVLVSVSGAMWFSSGKIGFMFVLLCALRYYSERYWVCTCYKILCRGHNLTSSASWILRTQWTLFCSRKVQCLTHKGIRNAIGCRDADNWFFWQLQDRSYICKDAAFTTMMFALFTNFHWQVVVCQTWNLMWAGFSGMQSEGKQTLVYGIILMTQQMWLDIGIWSE